MTTPTRRRGRPPGANRLDRVQTKAEHAIQLMRQCILRRLPASVDLGIISADLKALGEMHELKAREDQPFLSIQRLIDRYGIARKTVERLPIPRHKIGNTVRYSLADIEAYESQQRQEPSHDVAAGS